MMIYRHDMTLSQRGLTCSHHSARYEMTRRQRDSERGIEHRKLLRPRSVILASCKPGCKPDFWLAWACRKHVASRSKASRKQVESQLQTCLKPSDDRTCALSRLMQQVRDQVFDKKSRKRVESVSQTRTNLSKIWLQTWSKTRFAAG